MRVLLVLIFSVLINLKAFADGKELKAGAVLYLTNNNYMSVADEFKKGLELAAKDSSVPIKLIFEDDMNRGALTASSTEKLISINDVDVVFFSEYTQFRVGAPIARKKKVPAVSIWESSPEIEEMGDYAFGLGLWTPSAGAVPAQHAVNNLGAKRAAIIHDGSAWSNNVVKYFKNEFERLGGEITFEESHNQYETDFRTSISKLTQQDIDVLFAPVGDHPVPFFKQLKQSGFDKPVLSSDQISQEFIDAAGGALEGVMYSNADDRYNDKLTKMASRYVDVFEKQPHNIHLFALGYDAMTLVAKAWEQKGEGKLQDAMLEVKNLDGMLGPITLTENGTRAIPEVMYVVKNGKPVHIKG